MVDIAMMVAGVGMQFFNNYANNKKNEELQAKQREYQIASADHDFERMRRIQAESARIALEMEEELHQERMSDINNQYDSLLENFAHGFSISNWPLNVLPFIMKGESFGSLINGTSNSINMHCIFTPSNCDWFNEIFYDDLDLRVEAEMNNHWNAQSSHPIVYYGGGWNRRTMKKGFSFPEQIDLNDIDLLKVNLKNVPMMVVTPYFDPWLHFRIELWGMGQDSPVPFRIDIPHGEIDYTTRIFSYDYNKDNKEGIYEDDFQNVTIEEFVPYLVRLIGFVADKYFWCMYGIEPCLPQLIQSQSMLIKKIWISQYTELAYNIIHEISPMTLTDLRNLSTFINAIHPLLEIEDRNNIENGFVELVQHNYIPDGSESIPQSYEETISFFKEEVSSNESQSWVNISDFDEALFKKIEVERWNIVETVKEFKKYIESTDRFADINVSIYIEEDNFKTFIIHVYDMDTKKVLQVQYGFDYLIKTKLLKHSRNVKSIFKHETHNVIVCRYSRIDKLIEKLEDNTLTF